MTERRSRSRSTREGREDAADTVTILVVDDHAENLVALTAILEGPGRTLLTARSGRDALRALLRQEVAVILLDVHMPDGSGIDLLPELRAAATEAEQLSHRVDALTGQLSERERIGDDLEARLGTEIDRLREELAHERSTAVHAHEELVRLH